MREDLEQKLAKLTEFAGQRQQQAEQLQSEVANLRVTRQSADGLLTVTVTANGQLVDLRIDDRALRTGRELAASLLGVVYQASTAAAQQVQELSGPMLAESSIDFADLGIGATPPARPGEKSPAPLPRPTDPDEGFGSVFKDATY